MTTGDTHDTIAAIATPIGEAGIAVVRVSGPESFRVADAVFRGKGPPPSQRRSGTFVHGHVVDGDEVMDEVLLLVMRGRSSYTGEDTVELQGHGGAMPARRVLRRVLQAGARMAEPGEFTKRAFLNGRMDLTQAEAVLDLIRARSDRAASAALQQLDGALGRRINDIYDLLMDLAADVEASLDFPEEELPTDVVANLTARVVKVMETLKELFATITEGRLLRDGVRVVIAGRPNAGKSTLLNALLGSDRSIVSHHPGTTRDTIEEQIVIDGVPVCLVDTAGLHDSTCEVEQEGIRRTIKVLQNSDAYLYVVDGSLPCHEEDQRRLIGFPPEQCLIIKNKVDLGDRWNFGDERYVTVSTVLVSEVGLSDVRRKLSALVARDNALHESTHIVISERHASLIDFSIQHLVQAVSTIDKEYTRDLAASRIRDALEALGRIVGRVYETDLLNSVFSRFCIGK